MPSPEHLSDEELVLLYQSAAPGGEDSLNELFSRYHSRVALWCLRLTGDRQSAADLAQDVFIKAFRHLGLYRGDSKFSTWLYSIARNHCFDEIKARSTRPEQAGELALIGLADDAEDSHSRLEQQSSSRAVQELIRSAL